MTRNSTNESETIPTLDELEYKDYLENGVPVVVYLAVMCGVGFLGNIHVLMCYSKRRSRSHHQIFIVTLATLDILACSLSLPFEIADIRKNFTFTQNAVCKVFRSLNHFLTIGSGSLQVIIAFERYRKLCRPFDRQFTKHEIKIACGVGIGFAFLLSIPSFVFCGVAEHRVVVSEERNITVLAHDCTSSLPKFRESYIYLVVLLAVSTLLYVACLVMYIFVGKSLYRHHVRFTSYRRESDYINSELANNLDLENEDFGKKESTSFMKVKKATHAHNSPRTKRQKPKRSESQKSETEQANYGNFSLMMLLSTAISYAGYIPTIILGIIRSTNRTNFYALETGNEPLIAILMRAYFLNNVINPIVYLCMDAVFRQDCKQFWRRVCIPCKFCKCFEEKS